MAQRPTTVFSEPALGPLLNDLSRLLRREFDRRLRLADIQLTRAQWQILYHVARAQGCTQTELAEGLELERMTVGRHAARLEAEGWLERRPDARDRRAFCLHLRSKAERTLARLEPMVDQLRRDYFAGIDPQRRDNLFNDLLKVRANLVALDATHLRSTLS
jgi:MarR family transcriptional regulator, transcriptional regulator for hemolysin